MAENQTSLIRGVLKYYSEEVVPALAAAITTDDAIEKLKVLFADYDIFYANLDKNFAGNSAALRLNARKEKQKITARKSLVEGFCIGIATSVIGAIIYGFFNN